MPEPDGSGPAVEEVAGLMGRSMPCSIALWVMLSAGPGMEPFRRICAFAFEPGASGYLAGRALWWQALAAFPGSRRLPPGAAPGVEPLYRGAGERLHRTGTPLDRVPGLSRRHPSRPKAGPAFFSGVRDVRPR